MKWGFKNLEYHNAYMIGIGLNLVYVVVEVLYGLMVDSAALLADAGHNAGDVLSMLIAWTALFLGHLRPFGKYTYGLRKTTILSASINGILIAGAAGYILISAIEKIRNPVAIPANVLMFVAGIGIVVNTGTALLFTKGKKKDLNIKGTFLHMTSDAAVSAAVLTGGILIKYTGSFWIDPVLSFLIVIVILWSAGGLLKESFSLSVDAVPDQIDLKKVREFLQEKKGVQDVHELHIWALSTTETALTVHLVIPDGCSYDFISEIQEQLQQKFNITHCTVQIENIRATEYEGYKI